MSVSALEALKAKEQASLSKAKAKFELVNKVIDSLPAESPAPISIYDHGYCAVASITFEGEGLVRRLVEMYPPVPCANVRGGTQSQKPVKYLTTQEESYSQVWPIYPVVFKASSTEKQARWWTVIDGLDCEVSVRGARQDEVTNLPEEGKFYPDSHSYSSGSCTFMERKIVAPALSATAFEEWSNHWNRFVLDLKANRDAKYALAALKKDALTLGLLPKEKYAFAECLDKAQLEKLDQFISEQTALLPEIREQHFKEVEAVRTWFEQFFGQHRYLSEQDTKLKQALLIKMLQETKVNVNIQHFNVYRHSVCLRAHFSNDVYEEWTFALSGSDTAPSVLIQNLGVTFA